MVQTTLSGVDAASVNDVAPTVVELGEGDDAPATVREPTPWGGTAE
jgi:hypothetical protein